MSVWMTFILCAIKDACDAKQAHQRSIICRLRRERMLHPIIETSNSSITVSLRLTYTIANTHLLAGLFLSPKVTNRHCARFVFLWHVHTHTHTQIRLLLNASSRVSHSGARGRRQAKQSSVWWLLPQIVTTKHPEYWAAMLLIWRQAIHSVPAQWGKRSPQCPQFVSSACVWTQIIFICQCLCWGSAVERVDVQALISNTCLYQLLTCPLTTSNWK